MIWEQSKEEDECNKTKKWKTAFLYSTDIFRVHNKSCHFQFNLVIPLKFHQDVTGYTTHIFSLNFNPPKKKRKFISLSCD